METENRGFFSCNLSYILSANCRAKAKGAIRRIGSHIRKPSVTDSQPDKLSLMENPTKFRDWENELKEEGLRPIHVVTSEPTLHLCIQKGEEILSYSDPEQDSDVYYDFDLVSPDTYHSFQNSSLNMPSEFTDIKYSKLEENETNIGEKAESGCVTCSASPTVFEEEQEHVLFSPVRKNKLMVKRASDINLEVVRNILMSSHTLPYKSFSDNDIRAKGYFSHGPDIYESIIAAKASRELNPRFKLETFKRSEMVTNPEISKREKVRKVNRRKSRKGAVKQSNTSSSSSSLESEPDSYCIYYKKDTSGSVSSSESLPEVHSSASITCNKKPHENSEKFNIQSQSVNSQLYGEPISTSLINICENKLENLDLRLNLNSLNDNNMSKSDSGIVSKPCSFYYDPLSQQYYKASDVREAFVDSNRKISFEQQKARHIEKFYKSLLRKIPTKNLKYVNIELSDDISPDSCSNLTRDDSPKESQVQEDNSSQVSCERVTGKESDGQVQHADKESFSSLQTAVYLTEGEGFSCFRHYNDNELQSDVGYISLLDRQPAGIVNRTEVPLNVMHNSEGQIKVKKNRAKCEASDKCKDNISVVKKSHKQKQCLLNNQEPNNINPNDIQNGITCKKTGVKNGEHSPDKMFPQGQTTSKQTITNSHEGNVFKNNSTEATGVSSDNIGHKSSNGDKDTCSDSSGKVCDIDKLDSTAICSNLPNYNDIEVSNASEKINSKSYFSSSHSNNFISDCDNDINDEITTLSESDILEMSNNQEDEDDEDIILSGKFSNIVQYSEKVSSLAEEGEKYAHGCEVVYIDEEEQKDEEEDEEEESQESEVDSEQLACELEKIKNEEYTQPSLDVEPPSDESTRSSCERDSDDFKQRIKRSSSLKCGKTPPGTPGQKKIVRFADVLGLDLADVRTFLEGVPDVPKEAYCDLNIEEEAAAHSSSLAGFHVSPTITLAVSQRILTAMFQQPGGLPDFLDRVRCQKVSLESVIVGGDLSVRGIVRVYNLDFHKSVYVRYTFDHWKNFHETQASYMNGTNDGFTDRFSFLLWGNFLQSNGALVFCIRYCCKGEEYWDNNRGINYVLQCYPTPPSESKGLSGRPQNDSNVQQSSGGSGSHKPPSRSFLDTPGTPDDPWSNKFF